MRFAPLDAVLAAAVVIFTVRAGLRGFILEAGNLAAWMLGLLFAVSFYSRGAAFLYEQDIAALKAIPHAAVSALAFFALFAVVFLTVKFAGAMLNEIIERLNFRALDVCLGLIFGFLEGIAVSAFIIFIISRQPLFDKASLFEGSFFAAFLGGKFEAVAKTAGDALL